MIINDIRVHIYEAVRYRYKLCPLMIQFLPILAIIFSLKPLAIFKYLLIILMLHLSLLSCNIPYEIARMDYSQYGCFGGYTAQLLIHKKQSELMVRVEFDKKHERTIRITQAQLDFFLQFVDQLRKIRKSESCLSTTSIKYRVVSNGDHFERTPSCDFTDFDVFYKKLFAS